MRQIIFGRIELEMTEGYLALPIPQSSLMTGSALKPLGQAGFWGWPNTIEATLRSRAENAAAGYLWTAVVVKKAAERMGGSADVISELGNGSRFWVTFKKAQ